MGVAFAEDTVSLADSLRRGGGYGRFIVGIDLSGNPLVGDFQPFLPALRRARELGLSLAVHCAEIGGRQEEVDSMLALKPERLGHALNLSEDNVQNLLELNR